MKLPAEYQKYIDESFTDAIMRMEQSSSNEEKLYYFTVTFTNINRVLNLHFDSMLLFIHQELQAIRRNFTTRISVPISMNNIKIQGMPEEYMKALISITKDLHKAIIGGKDIEIFAILVRLAGLSYASTGNGFYLYVSGKLSIE